jgi:hypothetical protein
MKRRFRLGRHRVDFVVQDVSEEELEKVEELAEPGPDEKVVFSRTWTFGGPEPEEAVIESDEERSPMETVAEQPFRLRNVLLIPSALFIVLGAIGRDDSALYWLLIPIGFGGIGAWTFLRRRDKERAA